MLGTLENFPVSLWASPPLYSVVETYKKGTLKTFDSQEFKWTMLI